MTSYWKGRRVLVTGGKGFLGRHLCARLTAAGATVYVPTAYDLRRQEHVHQMFHAYCLPASSLTIFHLAARVSGIGAMPDWPATMLYDNLIMGLNILQQVTFVPSGAIEKIVLAGSVCAYPKNIPMPMREFNLWMGAPEETNGPYGVAKRTLSTAAMAYKEQYDLPVNYLLMANLYGEGDDFDPRTSHVIPALIRRMHEAREQGLDRVTLWGTGRASRDFLYVEDAAHAFMAAAEKLNTAEPINVGAGQEYTIYALAGMIAKIVGYEGEIAWDSDKPDGQPRRCLYTEEAERRFGWRSTTRLEDGLRKTYEWWLETRAHAIEKRLA